MLVFDKDFIQHISKDPIEGRYSKKTTTRICDRTDETVESLLTIIDDINQYMPTGWRMTRKKNSFALLVVAGREKKNFLFVGDSYRADEDIFHIIRTIYCPDWILKEEKELLFPFKTQKDITPGIIASIPEVMHPNAYYFRDYLDEIDSPVFVRQYERVKKLSSPRLKCETYHKCEACQSELIHIFNLPVDKTVQFHRIHPIRKEGIDLNHYRWIRWTSKGEVDLIPEPKNDFHGKDYWVIPEIYKYSDHETVQQIKERYTQTMQEYLKYCGKPPEHPDTAYEEEYKFLINDIDNVRSAEEIFQAIVARVQELGDCVLIHPKEVFPIAVEQVDVYLDDQQGLLLAAGVSCRVRRKSDVYLLTVKGRSSAAASEWFRRTEEEMPLTRSDADQLCIEGGALPEGGASDLLQTLLPGAKWLSPRISVRNHRRVWIIGTQQFHQRAELCCDIIWFISPQKGKSGLQVEIELESKGYPREELRLLAECLTGEFGMVSSVMTKYERAMAWLEGGS